MRGLEGIAALELSSKQVVQNTVIPSARLSYLGDVWKRLLSSNLARVGVGIVGLFLIMAFVAPLLTPYGPTDQTLIQRLKPPTMEHPFGMDHLGRDVFSRVPTDRW